MKPVIETLFVRGGGGGRNSKMHPKNVCDAIQDLTSYILREFEELSPQLKIKKFP